MRSNIDNNNIAIKILDKEFLISCPPENQPALLAAAKQLDQKMREIKTQGRVFGLERIAVMAALNLSHDLIEANQQLLEFQQGSERLETRLQQLLADSDSDTRA